MCVERRGRRWVCVLALGLLAGPGCLSFCNKVPKPTGELIDTCHACPSQCRNRVHVFVVNGFDVTNCCNLTGLCDCLRSIGYIKTYYGCPAHVFCFAGEMRRIHKEDAEARFVLIGYGFGGNLVDSLAWDLRKDGIPVDLIAYLDSNTIGAERPDNAARVLNIWSDGNMIPGLSLTDAENIYLTDAGPFAAPSSRVTLERLADELGQVAARIPVELPEEPAPVVPPETAPTPRPVMPQISERRDEWDFLKPVKSPSDWPVLTSRRKALKTETDPKAVPAEKATSR